MVKMAGILLCTVFFVAVTQGVLAFTLSGCVVSKAVCYIDDSNRILGTADVSGWCWFSDPNIRNVCVTIFRT